MDVNNKIPQMIDFNLTTYFRQAFGTKLKFIFFNLDVILLT